MGPTPSDGPLSVAVSTTLPEAPGVIVGDVIASATSALRAPAVTVVGDTVLFAVFGSDEALDVVAEPPVIPPGAVDAASDTGIATLVVAPLARPAAIVQVTVPEPSVQPDGNVPTVTPDGGVYVIVSGPAALLGPEFVTESDTAPEVPGVIVGEVIVSARSALDAPTVTVVGETVLLAVDGSAEAVVAEAEPPLSGPLAEPAAIETGIATDVEAPTARSPLTVQVTVPDASVQPDGSVPPEAGTVTPAGGV